MNNPPQVNCQCWSLRDLETEPCVCMPVERALRAWSTHALILPMTPDQREWCLQEIGKVEGYDRATYEKEYDAGLAKGVLSAWTDYARDKGFLD